MMMMRLSRGEGERAHWTGWRRVWSVQELVWILIVIIAQIIGIIIVLCGGGTCCGGENAITRGEGASIITVIIMDWNGRGG